MNRTRLLLAFVLFAVAALGDVVVPTEPAAFFGGWTPGNNGPQFWNHTSWDGGGCGIGFYIYGNMSPTCGSMEGDPDSGPDAAFPYLADAADQNNAPSDFYFSESSGASATLEIEVAGWADGNTLGAYYRSSAGEIQGTEVLFPGSAQSAATASFNPRGRDYGFYLTNGAGRTFYTESSRNAPEFGGIQHFVLFRETPAAGEPGLRVGLYWLGVEDVAGPLGASDRDFNDMVVRIETQATPEPVTLVLTGSALLALAFLGRRARRP